MAADAWSFRIKPTRLQRLTVLTDMHGQGHLLHTTVSAGFSLLAAAVNFGESLWKSAGDTPS